MMKNLYFSKILSSHFFKFIIVGAIGFIVDGSLLLMLSHLGLSLTISRLLSFSIAVSCTWALNKKWTFDSEDESTTKSNIKRKILYIAFQCVGAAINFFVFVFLTKKIVLMQSNPLMPFTMASGLAMVFNYSTSKFIVFKSRKFK